MSQAGLSGRFLGVLQRLGVYSAARSAFDSCARFTPAGIRARRRMLDLYANFIGPGDLCFDVGANLGDRTDLFLRLGARVVAVEPQESCRQKLERRFRSDRRVTVVGKALGRDEGEAEMFVSSAHTISSLAPGWMEKVRASGRFGPHDWHAREVVPMTTLDALIAVNGVPAFCKIDVEGYEPQVLQGLTHRLPSLSFEFTPEVVENAIECVDRLSALGPTTFNYSVGDSGVLALPEWVTREEITHRLTHLPDESIFGDVYARSTGQRPAGTA